MADIEVRRAHELGVQKARALAEEMARDLGRRFGLAGDWDGDVLRFRRPGVEGSLAVTGKEVHLSVTLGLLLKAMKGSIERAVQDELDRLFRAPPAAKPRASPKKGR